MVRESNTIVVIVDRLGSGWLGPYGNTWTDTPELNRLASQSFLFEHALTDSPGLELVYRSYWQGLHAMCPLADPGPRSLPALLAEAGVNPTLLTDDPRVAECRLAGDFDQPIRPSGPVAEEPVDEAGQSQLGQLFRAAIDWLQQASSPFLLWIHARGMDGLWDAPFCLRNQFADGEDPVPPSFVVPPQQKLPDDYDPDELLGVMQAYAGQVALVDIWLGALLDVLANRPTTLLLTSPRGFPIGEHLRVVRFR